MHAVNNAAVQFDPYAITRPHRTLMIYYFLVALLSGPFFPIVILPLWFKYETLRYQIDKSGVSVRWGILFRRDIHLTYRRIQDIHLTRNIVQRWMGLATVTVQTASGGVGPQMTFEGILEAEPLRDFLYRQMRGARGEADDAVDGAVPLTGGDEGLALLQEIRDLLQQLVRHDGSPS